MHALFASFPARAAQAIIYQYEYPRTRQEPADASFCAQQYHTSPEQRQLAQKMMSSPGKHKNLDYDALIDVYVRDFQDFVNAFNDPLYITEIRPDEDAFCDTASMILSVGTDYVLISEGEMIESHEGETWWRD